MRKLGSHSDRRHHPQLCKFTLSYVGKMRLVSAYRDDLVI
jgi:hypothetical protein